MKKIINLGNISRLAVLGLGLPLVAGAQSSNRIDQLPRQIGGTLNIVIVLLFALITIYFIWGVIQYVTAGGDDEKLAKGKKHMLWGIIGLAVVASAWGLARLLIEYVLGGGNVNPPPPPQI